MRRLLTVSLTLVLTLGSGSVFAQDGETPTPAGAFEAAGKTKIRRSGHVAAALPDGRVLIIGGMADGGPSRQVEIWDPASGEFDATGGLKTGRMFAAAATLDDGRVLVMGGEGPDGTVRSAEVWDPETGAFTPAGKLKTARFWMGTGATTLADGRVVVVGGGGDGIVDTVETWDPTTGAFSVSGELPKPRWGHSTTLLPDGRLLIVGGGAEAYLWDPSGGTVTDAGRMQTSRSHHTATLLPDGHVLVVGGSTVNETTASAETWDPATNTFSKTGSMAEPRASHSAFALPDGRVLVAGGVDEDGFQLATSEVWDPLTGRFEPSSPLAHARERHSATKLPDGRVLIVGGGDAGPGLRAAEVWDPSAVHEVPAPPAALTLAACAADASDPATSALLAQFPISLEGIRMEAMACHGREWLGVDDAAEADTGTTIERAEALLGSQGKTIDDLVLATALHEPVPGQVSTITALRVDGANASSLVDPAIPLLLGIERPDKRTRTVGPGDLEIIEVRDETVPGGYPTVFYTPLGDTLWVITASRRSLLEEIAAALPGPGGRFASEKLGVAVTFPDDWQAKAGPERVGPARKLGPDAVEWNVAGGSAPWSEDDSSDGWCVLKVYRPTDLTARKAFKRMLASGDGQPSQPEQLEGGLLRFAGPGSFFGGDTDTAIYVSGSGDSIALLLCMADQAPDDLWLPLAESIEFLPAD